MERVVYILGAGFSAPLGLPLMWNFLVKAKDMHSADPEKYRHFERIFNQINSMGVAKSYYEADLFNIEEILSILEMRERVAGGDAQPFVEFICDVVQHFTPVAPKPKVEASNWYDVAFEQWRPHFGFVASLFGITLAAVEHNLFDGLIVEKKGPERPLPAQYGIISLNYDLVLETTLEAVNQLTNGRGPTCELKRSFDGTTPDAELSVPLAKLHGSVDTRRIIAPTWNKGIDNDPAITSTWRKALELLKAANHIRIIGYSLPISDAYIRYLLKAAVVDSPHLKSIDIIARDSEGALRKRYQEFVTFKFMRFRAADTEEYLEFVYNGKRESPGTSGKVSFEHLEEAHERFMVARS